MSYIAAALRRAEFFSSLVRAEFPLVVAAVLVVSRLERAGIAEGAEPLDRTTPWPPPLRAAELPPAREHGRRSCVAGGAAAFELGEVTLLDPGRCWRERAAARPAPESSSAPASSSPGLARRRRARAS